MTMLSPTSKQEALDDAQEAVANPGPRVTEDRINEVIKTVDFFKLTQVMTVCVITLINGYEVLGKSACASPENFDAEIGKDLAFEDARQQIWHLEGYLLKQWLAVEASAEAEAVEAEAVEASRIILVNP